jgi:hypothetical protein
MDHLVCLDERAMEMENLIKGNKSMLLRGADQLNHTYVSVSEGDVLYFTDSRISGEIRARGIVSYVYRSDKLSVEESYETIIKNQDKLQLPDNQFYFFAGKCYLVFITVKNVEEIMPIPVGDLSFPDPDNWIPVGNINLITSNRIVSDTDF